MLTFWGGSRQVCDGVSRRDYLRVGALGAGAFGLSLADVLRLQAAPATVPGTTGRRTKDKAVIMVFLPGGPSPIDMYDPKPDAPAEYRGEFKAIGTNVDGAQICELFPRQARLMDKMAVLRAVVGSDGDHAAWQFMTGYPRAAPILLALAVLWPTLALIGGYQGTREVIARSVGSSDYGYDSYGDSKEDRANARTREVQTQILWAYVLLVAGVFVARGVRAWRERRAGVVGITYPGGRLVRVPVGRPLPALPEPRADEVKPLTRTGGRK